MKLKTENTMNRLMNNGRTKKYDLPGIHSPGTHEDCRNQTLGHTIATSITAD